jgi:hypothetical protein
VPDGGGGAITGTFENRTAYPYYRLNITRNNGNGLTQLAELELWADDVVLPAAAPGNSPAKCR